MRKPVRKIDQGAPGDPAVHVVVPAAGRGERFGGPIPKLFVELAGRPVLAWTLDRLLAGGARSVTVALDAERAADPPEWLAADSRVRWVAGGETRQASVALALAACPATAEELVAVHDGARPVLAAEDLARVCAAARGADGAVLGRAVADTVKQVVEGRIVGTVDRRGLFRAETPQVFTRATLEEALRRAAVDGAVGTDESSLVERLAGARVVAVEARFANPKVTVVADLRVVEQLLRASAAQQDREGNR